MGKNYTLPIYSEYVNLVHKLREQRKTWKEIDFACKSNDDELDLYLETFSDLFFDERITTDDWKSIVNLVHEKEDEVLEAAFRSGSGMVTNNEKDNSATIPTSTDSAWQLYKKHLLKQGFKDTVVEGMEKSTIRTLKRLSLDTVDKQAVKGMVIGNVQSGKTANMAALMAMAADWGWNMFIILSGTIDNLRKQTQTRLLNDLSQPGMLSWHGLEQLSKNCDDTKKAQFLNFEEGSHDRYFTVCLKNSTRLANLIQWLQADKNKQKQMKILVIDDEADQAGVNTKKIVGSSEEQERNRINGLIVSLVNGFDEKGNKSPYQYRAMNYIGYTATPYANILNESSLESIYPRNFITTLSVSNEYFGPQQIFGVEGMDYDGLDIVRTIESEELSDISAIHDGDISGITASLENAIAWFLCGTSAMRLWGYKKPISMLIHTSQKQVHHKHIADVVVKWLKKTSVEKIVEKCECIWKTETTRFSFENFKAQYPDYGREWGEINQYPQFGEIVPGIKLLIDEVTNIQLGDEGEFSYHKGIHVCIDNCKNNGINEDGMYLRLAYPNSHNMPSPAPAFIVIGGATLSRGLTIEGLISTVFLRTVGQADTLMQMGRWFGYRKGYELIPRIWLTEKTKLQFEFLASLDQALRDEIYYMDMAGISPSEYGPKVKNTPMYKFIRITAANRMQTAQETDVDFSGSKNQTILFDDSEDMLFKNKQLTEAFIEKLGAPYVFEMQNPTANNNLVWKNVQFSVIAEYLRHFVFCKNMRVFNDVDSIIQWINKMTQDGAIENWNIIVSGTNSGKVWKTKAGNLHMVTRTRRKKNTEEGLIDIGVLRTPSDLVADIEPGKLSEDGIGKLHKFKTGYEYELRKEAGLLRVPQLIIYCIDKDSCVKNNAENRENLNAKEDIVGICLNIPGAKPGQNTAAMIQIRLEESVKMDEEDLTGDTYED